MRLTQLDHFLAIVESGSIREAARRVGLSQPALTKSIRTLETELQIQMMRRSTRGIIPTPAGLAFAARARAVKAELRKAREEIAQLSGQATGEVAFGVGQASALSIAPGAIMRFRERWPAARIRIIEGLPATLLPLVREETLDFAVGARADDLDASLAFRPLYRSARVIVGRKGHPLRQARTLADLASAEWIAMPPLESISGTLEQLFKGAGLATPPTIVRCDSYNTAAALIAKSNMLALISVRQLAAPYASHNLEPISVRESIPAFTVGMFTRADVPLGPAALAMARAFTAVARRLASAREG